MTDIKSAADYARQYRVPDGKSVSLKDWVTDEKDRTLTKDTGEALLQSDILKLSGLQDKLYASGKYSVLIVIQAMDAAGKDSVIKHVMTGLNPQGVNVTSFKVPTKNELAHDYLWRHAIALPGRGLVGIFNRSHYENVLVTRVHPEYIAAENIPGIAKPEDIPADFWEKRFRQINQFERNLTENGTLVLKFFLHVSKKEQKKRFLARIEDPAKNWKFSAADLKERQLWKEYRKAYEELLENTSKETAPWYVLPADDKWFTQFLFANIIVHEMEKLNLQYPVVNNTQKADLLNSKTELEKEE